MSTLNIVSLRNSIEFPSYLKLLPSELIRELQFFYDNVPWQSPYYNVKLLYKQPTHSSALYTLEFLSDEGLLVTGGASTMLTIWNFEKGSAVRTMLVEHASVYNFARYTVRSESSKTAELVLVGSEDPCVHGFDLLTGTEILRLAPIVNGTLGMKVVDHILFTGSGDGHIKIWNLDTSELLSDNSAHSHWVWSIDVKDTTVVSSSENGEVVQWRLRENYSLHRVRSWSMEHAVQSIVLIARAPDQLLVAIGGSSSQPQICLHSTVDGSLVGKLQGHESRIKRLLLHEGLLVSSSEDGTIRFWDLSTFRQVRKVEVQGGSSRSRKCIVYAVRIWRNLLAAACGDGMYRIWALEPNDQLTEAVHKPE